MEAPKGRRVTTLDTLDALHEAYDARDAAMTRAMQEVERQFAGIIKRRQQEFQDAIRRAVEAGNGRSAVALGNQLEAI